MIGYLNCLITANCPMTTIQYDLVKNEAAIAPIMFEEFVKVVTRLDTCYACTFVMQFTELIVFFSFSHEKIEAMARFFS